MNKEELSRWPKIRQVGTYVKPLLELAPVGNVNYRDNDEQLVARYWAEQIARSGHDPKKLTAHDFLTLYAHGILVPADDITRARRDLQEQNEVLRGSKWGQRQRVSKRMRQEKHQI